MSSGSSYWLKSSYSPVEVVFKSITSLKPSILAAASGTLILPGVPTPIPPRYTPEIYSGPSTRAVCAGLQSFDSSHIRRVSESVDLKATSRAAD